MARTIRLVLVIGLVAFSGGCFVSEQDYQKLAAEREDLLRELTEAKEENTILNQSILEIYKERDSLLKQVEDCRGKLKDRLAERPDKPDKPAGQTQPDKPHPTGAARYYEVKPGDTLSAIAQQTGVSIQTIRSLNTINGDIVWIGQKLRLE
ncbi:MAG: LysM peptidoglycan-binding domain-containing protein [Thermodesulfobacteriota bacterium]